MSEELDRAIHQEVDADQAWAVVESARDKVNDLAGEVEAAMMVADMRAGKPGPTMTDLVKYLPAILNPTPKKV